MLKLYYRNSQPDEAGVDEAGRGCLAGPVVASAVILDTTKTYDWYALLNDSKKLKEQQRDELRIYIERDAKAWAVGFADHLEIDGINILNATYLAMHRAISRLPIVPAELIIDGNRFKPYKRTPHSCAVKGDATYLSIAAASILAKTHRDEYMYKIAREFPDYGWNQNKAYATLKHRRAIDLYGLSPYHRRTFKCRDRQLKLELEGVK